MISCLVLFFSSDFSFLCFLNRYSGDMFCRVVLKNFSKNHVSKNIFSEKKKKDVSFFFLFQKYMFQTNRFLKQTQTQRNKIETIPNGPCSNGSLKRWGLKYIRWREVDTPFEDLIYSCKVLVFIGVCRTVRLTIW